MAADAWLCRWLSTSNGTTKKQLFAKQITSLGACTTALAALMLLLFLLSSNVCVSISASRLLLGAASVSPVDMLLVLELFLRASGEAERRSEIQIWSDARSASITKHLLPFQMLPF